MMRAACKSLKVSHFFVSQKFKVCDKSEVHTNMGESSSPDRYQSNVNHQKGHRHLDEVMSNSSQ
jgi:hypothetical protein